MRLWPKRRKGEGRSSSGSFTDQVTRLGRGAGVRHRCEDREHCCNRGGERQPCAGAGIREGGHRLRVRPARRHPGVHGFCGAPAHPESGEVAPRTSTWRTGELSLLPAAIVALDEYRLSDARPSCMALPRDVVWTVEHVHDEARTLRWADLPQVGKLIRAPRTWAAARLSWAYDSARLASEGERTLADELGGPLAQLLTTTDNGPTGTGTDDDEDDDPNRDAKLALRGARGDAVLVETTSAAAGDGSAASPRRDWDPRRLGPDPPETLALLRRDSFAMMLAACGVPAGMWESGADGHGPARSA